MTLPRPPAYVLGTVPNPAADGPPRLPAVLHRDGTCRVQAWTDGAWRPHDPAPFEPTPEEPL